jgi:hypothetical protein
MIFFIGKEDAIPDEFINVQQMGRCVPLMDYKRNFVHQTRNKFFRIDSMDGGNCLRFLNLCERITNKSSVLRCSFAAKLRL